MKNNKTNNDKSFSEYMNENHEINRWGIFKAALISFFAGACTAMVVALIAMV